MTSKRFVFLSLILLYGSLLCVTGAFYRINFYGQFGDVTGVSRKPYFPNARVSKYLFAYNYIPSNFDALLVGSSNAANWNTSEISGYRMYNISISGGNASEERLLVETVLKRSQIRLVIIAINPYLTLTNGLKTMDMVPRQYWGSLGSPQLLRGLLSKLAVQRGWIPDFFDNLGTDDFTIWPAPQNVATKMRLATETYQRQRKFAINPAGLEDLRQLIEAARRHGARIVLVHPPMYRERFATVEEDYNAYRGVVDALFLPSDLTLDFNTTRYDTIRGDLANYYDHVHFSRRGAKKIMEEINRCLQEPTANVDSLLPTASNDDVKRR